MPVHVAAIAALRGGRALMGKRRDSGKWAFPGGHVEPGEEHTAAAHRELYEETGLKVSPAAMKHHGTTPVKGSVHVHAFRAFVGAGEPTNKNDPDKEFSELKWVDPRNLPSDVRGNLHNSPDVVLNMLKPRPSTMNGHLDSLNASLSQED